MKKLLLAGLLAALPSLAVTIIADSVMAGTDYDGPNLQFTASGTSANVSSSGGVRNLQLNLPGATFGPPWAFVADYNIPKSFTPTIAIPLTSLSMAIDVTALSGIADPSAQFFLYFAQGASQTTVLTTSLTPGTKTATWNGNITGGGPIRFGYGFSNISFLPAPSSVTVTTDNFCVIGNEGGGADCAGALRDAQVPEPGTFAMLGVAAMALGLVHRRRR